VVSADDQSCFLKFSELPEANIAGFAFFGFTLGPASFVTDGHQLAFILVLDVVRLHVPGEVVLFLVGDMTDNKMISVFSEDVTIGALVSNL